MGRALPRPPRHRVPRLARLDQQVARAVLHGLCGRRRALSSRAWRGKSKQKVSSLTRPTKWLSLSFWIFKTRNRPPNATTGKMPPRYGGGGERCAACSKWVYAAEKVVANASIYHADCFRCAHCRVKLNPARWCRLASTGAIYCPAHFGQHGAEGVLPAKPPAEAATIQQDQQLFNAARFNGLRPVGSAEHPVDKHPAEKHPLDKHPVGKHPTDKQPSDIPFPRLTSGAAAKSLAPGAVATVFAPGKVAEVSAHREVAGSILEGLAAGRFDGLKTTACRQSTNQTTRPLSRIELATSLSSSLSRQSAGAGDTVGVAPVTPVTPLGGNPG